MARYKLILEYDGTNLIGWQENTTGPSVQALLADAIFRFSGAHVNVVAAGRTDAGVHAIAMPAHFDIGFEYDPQTIMNATNAHLRAAGAPVAVLSCEVVPDDFHARFSCVKRHYRYVIINRRAPLVLNANRAWWVPRPLDISAMRAAAAGFIGRHDWTSFRSSECQAKSPIKTLDELSITMDGDRIIFDISARSFLHHQVRNIVGTLVEIGLGKPLDIDAIFAAQNRSAAGPTAPAMGLYFVSAEY